MIPRFCFGALVQSMPEKLRLLPIAIFSTHGRAFATRKASQNSRKRFPFGFASCWNTINFRWSWAAVAAFCSARPLHCDSSADTAYSSSMVTLIC